MSVSFSTVPAGAIASGVFIEPEYKRAGVSGPIPQKIAILGQYNSGKTPAANVALNITSADEAANAFGVGSMLHRLAVKLFAGLGSGSVQVDAFPLGNGVGTAAGTITITGPSTSAGTMAFYVAGDRVPVVVTNAMAQNDIATAIGAAINAKLDLPVTAGVVNNVVTLTCRWVGLSGNQISIEQDLLSSDVAAEPTGLTVVIVDMASGVSDPLITTALTNFGGTFYTWVVCPYNADASLDLLEASGAARIDAAIKKPFAGVVGYSGTRADFLTWLSSRNSPWTTAVPVDSSPNHPGEIAAAAVGSCALSASSEPARPFKTLALPGILDGGVAPWTYAQRDAVEAAGGSVTYVDTSGIVRIYDLLTTYVTNALGAVDESYRYTVTITNIQAKIYSLDQLFLSAPFDRAVVVSDDAVTGKEFAVSPKRVKAFIINLIDSQWIPEAWSKDRDTIVAGIVCEINSTNPGRIDVVIPDVIAVGLRIMAVKYQWSFASA